MTGTRATWATAVLTDPSKHAGEPTAAVTADDNELGVLGLFQQLRRRSILNDNSFHRNVRIACVSSIPTATGAS